MKSGLDRILLPVTIDNNFENTVKLALNFSKFSGAAVTVLAVDDDSPGYVTAELPFHVKELNPAWITSDSSGTGSITEGLKRAEVLAFENDVEIETRYVSGHAATQILLVSRYYDLVVLSESAKFQEVEEMGTRRVNPLFEILDQAVVPTLLCGQSASPKAGGAAIYFDGSPSASVALHQLAMIYRNAPGEKVSVRVSTFEKPIATILADDAASFLKSKGIENVSIEYSSQSPVDFAQSHSNDDTSLAVLGIRSRQVFHDFRIGALANHFLKEEPTKNKLFC